MGGSAVPHNLRSQIATSSLTFQFGSQYTRLFCGELKHEVFWESAKVTFDGFVQALRSYLIEFGQVSIKHDLLPTNEIYLIRDSLDGDNGRRDCWCDHSLYVVKNKEKNIMRVNPVKLLPVIFSGLHSKVSPVTRGFPLEGGWEPPQKENSG
jgi:hypothetical protein